MTGWPLVAALAVAMLGIGADARAVCTAWDFSTGTSISTPSTCPVGIGITAPDVIFHVVTINSAASPRGIVNDHVENDPVGSQLWLRKARGTVGSKTAIADTSGIGNILFAGYDGSAYAAGGGLRANAIGGWSGSSHGTSVTLQTTPSGSTTAADRLLVTDSGTVAINTAAGSVDTAYKLYVTGNVKATGTIGANYQDVAEWVDASKAMAPGTVAVLDRSHSNRVSPSSSTYDTGVAGVVSGSPGIILGSSGQGRVMVATTGRVRVRVDASRSPIRIGDLLVTGEREGVAMRSIPVEMVGVSMHRPGTVIGKALEPLAAGDGEILVLLSLQ